MFQNHPHLHRLTFRPQKGGKKKGRRERRDRHTQSCVWGCDQEGEGGSATGSEQPRKEKKPRSSGAFVCNSFRTPSPPLHQLTSVLPPPSCKAIATPSVNEGLCWFLKAKKTDGPEMQIQKM
ncbi:hypothetical protein L2E82_20653 [Cichorium intybus]|uniref:Uncharacterized protein n=1 Tax=Cichorium intybus TaxID=13427 RepID=A0ACB9DTM3_CICIN|nr:hypothetical protein L2E82_20653 [Cichorium intybus]